MADEALISGRVARVIDVYSVAINRGAEHGVRSGMFFNILNPQGEPVVDPDTNLPIGYVSRMKATVKVTQVYDKWAICSTYRMTGAVDFSKIFQTPLQSGPMLERLASDAEQLPALAAEQRVVRVGDPVVEVRTAP